MTTKIKLSNIDQPLEGLSISSPSLDAAVFTGNTAFDTSTLFVDAANNRVGVGTTSPAVRVDISGDVPAACEFVGTVTGTTLDVTSVTSGALAVGQYLTPNARILRARIVALGTGTGGVGTYTIDTDLTDVGIINRSYEPSPVTLNLQNSATTFSRNMPYGVIEFGGSSTNTGPRGFIETRAGPFAFGSADMLFGVGNGDGSTPPNPSLRLSQVAASFGVSSLTLGDSYLRPDNPIGVLPSTLTLDGRRLSIFTADSNLSNLVFKASYDDGGVTTTRNYGQLGYKVASTITSGELQSHFYVSTNSGGFNPTERLRITSTGNVGIGTTNPLVPLQIEGTGFNVAGNTYLVSAHLQDTTNYRGIYLGYESDEQRGWILGAGFNSSLSLGTFTSGGAINQAVNINGSGNVGIGTDSPTALLDVNGDALVNGLTVGLGAGSVATNTAVGFQALYSNTTGTNNTANGLDALYSNTTGGNNTATGYRALYSNTEGDNLTANGYQALYYNTTGINNVANGLQALYYNTTGNNNTGIGVRALYNNTTGASNIAIGRDALTSNTTGSNLTANGYQALYSNTEGTNNVANGLQALYYNTTGNTNTAVGFQALFSNTTGSNNTANGYRTLYINTTGSDNTAVGLQALYNNTTGSGNTAIHPRNSFGVYTPVFDPTTENNRFCMGSTSVTNAYIQVAWTVVSDERDKTELAPVPHGLDFVKALKPTSFRYKADRDSTEGHGPTRYGFLAQEVLALEGDNPVIIDNENPEKLRMTDQSLIAVLVNAIQDQQKIIETLEDRITALENT